MPWKISLPDRYTPSVSWSRLLPTMAIAALGVVLFDAGVDATRARGAHASRATHIASPLKLRAKLGAEQMEISWDHDAAALQDAQQGVLKIQDGDVTEAVPFDAAQLRDGVLVYRPRTTDVSVRMEVNKRDGQQLSESVRAVRLP
jgi:hypothetical protein